MTSNASVRLVQRRQRTLVTKDIPVNIIPPAWVNQLRALKQYLTISWVASHRSILKPQRYSQRSISISSAANLQNSSQCSMSTSLVLSLGLILARCWYRAICIILLSPSTSPSWKLENLAREARLRQGHLYHWNLRMDFDLRWRRFLLRIQQAVTFVFRWVLLWTRTRLLDPLLMEVESSRAAVVLSPQIHLG